MDIPGLDIFSRELLSGVTFGQALFVFAVIIAIVQLINRIQRSRMVK